MHRREALARGERSRTDTMHIVVTSMNSLLILLAIWFASAAFGTRFRRYSIGTMLVPRRGRRADRHAGAPGGGEPADAFGRA